MAPTFEQIRQIINEMNVQKGEALCGYQELTKALIEAKEKMCHMEGVNGKLIDELDFLDVAEMELKCESERLRRCIALRTKEFEKQCDEITKLEADMCQLKSNLDCACKINCEIEQQVSELEMCIKERDAYISRLKLEAAQMDSKVCEIKSANEYLSHGNCCLKDYLKNCQCDVQKANQELECLCPKEQECTIIKTQLQNQIECMQLTLQRNCDGIQKEQAINNELRAQIKNSQNENNRLNMDNFDFHQKKLDLTGALVASNKQLKRIIRMYNRAKCEYEQLKKCIDKFQTQVVSEYQELIDCME